MCEGYDAKKSWRGGRDSNPRGACAPSGLANRRTRPTMRPPRACQHGQVLTDYWRREWDSNPRGLRLVVFKTTALNRSAISPKPALFTCGFGRRDRNRTCNLRFWRPLLCLIELPAYRSTSYHTDKEFASSISGCSTDRERAAIIALPLCASVRRCRLALASSMSGING